VLALLSRGGALDVYDLWSEERDCRCIGKTLRPDRLEDADARRMLLREGRLLQRMSHPHIVRCYEVLSEPTPVVILETLTGATLGHLVKSGRRISSAELATLGLHLCSAVGYLHRRTGVLHLDLKPSNIIAEAGRAKVIDFSIARRPGRGHRGVGSPQYMSPEQARGSAVSEVTDVWGIGAVLYTIATGQRPFRSERDDALDQLARRADPVRRHRRIPAGLAALVDACLSLEPAERPTTESLARALAPFAGGPFA
jgi:serine/threonine protein kinase